MAFDQNPQNPNGAGNPEGAPAQQQVGSFDPNAASYVPNSAAYNQAQQTSSQAQPVVNQPVAQVPQQPVEAPAAQPQSQAQPAAQQHYTQPIPGAAPQGQPYVYQVPVNQQAPAGQTYGQAPQGQPYAQAPQSQPYQQGMPQGQPYQQGVPTQPYQQNPYQAPVKNHETSSKVLGILSIVCAFISPLVSWVLGGIGLAFASKDRKIFGNQACKVGFICSIIGIVLAVLNWIASVAMLLMGGDASSVSGSSSSTFSFFL